MSPAATGVPARLRRYVGEFGVSGLMGGLAWRARQHARRARERVGGPPPPFTYRGEPLAPFRHRYNRTWLNEREVEVAVALRFLERFPAGARGLEVGNVLSHYRPVPHRVVDKYERAPGVENLDVLEVRTDVPLDYVVAISTLEHVGWDEPRRDIGKAPRALAHLRSLLARPEGRLLVTVPLGYHPGLDAIALGGGSGAEHAEVLLRRPDGGWRGEERPPLHRIQYHHEVRSARAVWIAEFPPA